MEQEKTYEFNAYWNNSNTYTGCDIFSDYNPDIVKNILNDPINHNKQIRSLSRLVYNTSPIVANAVDYIVSLPCLSHILTSDGKSKSKIKKNKIKVEQVLSDIHDKNIMRDFLFRDCLDGACYYYFEVAKPIDDNTKFLSDFEIEQIYELNSQDISVSMIPLPVDYVKIRGYKNNRAVIAFNLDYFNEHGGEKIENKLKCFPREIREAFAKYKTGNTKGNWVVLDNNKTITHKIKSDKREPYGRPITIAALADIFYNDFLTSTKRSVLNEVNNKIIYQTLPEGREKGKCSLTEKQQSHQHNTVKSAIMTKNNRGGTSFFSVANGTKIDTVNTSVDVLNQEIEPKLNSQIAMGLGYALGLLDGESGNYSSQQLSLELLFSKVYSWVSEIAEEFNYVINKNIIKDKNNEIKIYYLPTSLVNKDKFVSTCKELYMAGSGSKAMWIAATGVDVNAYVSLMDMEKTEKWDEKYPPHATSFNSSGSDLNKSKGGRPEEKNPINESTLATKSNNTNNQPKPSTS